MLTLRDAAQYITRLRKAEHEATEWQAAMEALILVATLGGPTMFARIGIMRALNRHDRARVRSVTQGKALGPAQTRARSMKQDAVGVAA